MGIFLIIVSILLVVGCSRNEVHVTSDPSVGSAVTERSREPKLSVSRKDGGGVAVLEYWLGGELPSQIQMAVEEFRDVKRLRRELKTLASESPVEPSPLAKDEFLALLQADKAAEVHGVRVWRDSKGYAHLIGLGEMTIDVDESDKAIWMRYRRFAEQKASRSCEMLSAGEYTVKIEDQPDGRVVQTVTWKRGRLVVEAWCACEKRESGGIVRLISVVHAVPGAESDSREPPNKEK